MPTPTRQRLTEAAARRFYRDGFRSVGLDQLLSEVGISKTAFYKHFTCKEELVLAALAMQDQWLRSTFRELLAELGGTAPEGQLRALIDVVERFMDFDGYQGCIFINVAIEFPLQHEPAHVAAAQHKRAMEDIICEVCDRAGSPDPRAMAQELCLIMEGAYVTRQISGDRIGTDAARRIVELSIAAHLSDTARPEVR